MGLELYITRATNWYDDEGAQIGADEWLAYVAQDPELTMDPANSQYFAIWTGVPATEEN
jgi:hypothetical protein